MLCCNNIDPNLIQVKAGDDNSNNNTKKNNNNDDKDGPVDITSFSAFSKKEKENNEEEGNGESTPHQLAQFHITVTAKLRPSTLVSFLIQGIAQG